MIVCAKCGNANESSDEFCGSCGAFLEWHGERVVQAPVPQPVPVPEAPTERPGLIERVRYVVGLDDQLSGQQHPPVIQTGGLGAPPVGTLPPRENPTAVGPPVADGSVVPPVIPTAGLGGATETLPPRPPFPSGNPISPVAGGGPQPVPPVYTPPRPPQPPTWPPTTAQPPTGQPPTGQQGVGGRLPGGEYERQRAQRPVATDLGPADVYCGSCGAGNLAGRRFCRKCGTSLEDAVVAKRSWWRRVFGGGSAAGAAAGAGGRRGLDAGERPRNWQRLSVPEGGQADAPADGGRRKRKFRMPKMPERLPIGRTLGPLLMVASIVGFGVPALRAHVTQWGFGAYHSVMRVVHPQNVLVAAKSVTANSTAKGHQPQQAIDQNPDTYWSEGLAGDGAGAQLTIVLSGPTNLSKIGFDNGAAGKDFTAQPRVKKVEVSYFDKEKTRTLKETVTIDDTNKLQDFDLKGEDVASVTVKILESYPGQKGSAASLREVVFWRLK